MTYIPLVSPLAPASCNNYESSDHEKEFSFNSRLAAETTVSGMTLKTVLPDYQPPPGLSFTKGPHLYEALGGDQKKDQEQDNSFPYGFMKRYWYILLPLFLMNFISSGPPVEQGAEGAAAGSATTNAGASKRRGKRD